MSGAVFPITYYLPVSFNIGEGDLMRTCTPLKAYGCIMLGLWSGFVIGWVTEMYTSNAYSPV